MKERRTPRVEPAFPVTCGGASAEEQHARLQLIGEAEPSDCMEVDKILDDELTTMVAGMTPAMQRILPENFRAAYREQRYFSVFAEVIGERQASQAAMSCPVIAQVQPHEGCSEAADVHRRKALLEVATPALSL